MTPSTHQRRFRSGHTLMEMMVASVASTVLLAGLGSVMMIGRQVAYTPANANRRIEAADVVSQISEELRHATLLIQQTPQILEFVVADRDDDGTAEKIRYEWSGTPGTPLYKTLNGGTPVAVLQSVRAFEITATIVDKVATLNTTVQSAEGTLLGTTMSTAATTGITRDNWLARQIDPALFPAWVGGVSKSSAVEWNATRVRFYAQNAINPHAGTVFVQIRTAGDLNSAPTSQVLGEAIVPEAQITSGKNWNNAQFTSPVTGLSFSRKYSLAWQGDVTTDGNHALIVTASSAAGNLTKSANQGASWEPEPLDAYYQLYGTYTTAGPTYTVTRSYASHIRIALRTGEGTHSRIDAGVPLINEPELVTTHWRADFDRNPTTTNYNGDAVSDWGMASGTFDTSKLTSGQWLATGAIETRPLSDFTTNTIVECRCRNTSTGGNGAVVRINADRQGGQHAPLLVYVQRQSDGTQNVSLISKSSDTASDSLCTRTRLPSDFLRFRLIIVPQSNVVNFQINDQDQGTFTYSTYTPSSSSTDRFLTLYSDTSTSEFDYIDVRSY